MIRTRLMELLPQAKKHIACQVMWQWVSLICQIVLIFCAAALLEQAVYGRASAIGVGVRALVIVCMLCLRFFCDRQASLASFRASADVKQTLRDRIYQKLLRLGTSYRESTGTSAVVQMAAEGVEQLETYFGKYMPQLFYSLLAPLTLFAVLSFVSLKASVVLLVCVPLIPMAIVAVQKIAKKLLNKYWGMYTQLGDSFLEDLQGLTTLKIYRADGWKAAQMDEESQHFRKITMKVLTMQLNSTSVMDIVAYGGAAAGMAVALSAYAAGSVTLSGALMLILLASEFFLPMRRLGSYFHIAMNGMAASDRIFALLDQPEPEKKGEQIQGDQVNIRISDVQFSYEEDREILSGVSMDIPAGGFVSIVGTSGCGKSTVAGLLMGRNRGFSGSITINGRPLSEISEESLMKNITLVTHASYLFKGTVEENLLMGNPDADREKLIAALQAVNLWEFLKGQQGLDTVLLERASNLSGGQRQRLAIARALLHDSPVYIFDEATSNIDAESEDMIMCAVHSLAKRQKTVLLISHRLANVVGADRIYMMEQGRVAESGTHEELMAAGGAYRRLFLSQKELEAYGKGENDGAAEA